MKKGNGSGWFFWAIIFVGGLFVLRPSMSDMARTSGGQEADTADTLPDNVGLQTDTPGPVSVFVPDSVFVSGINVRLINSKLIFVRDSFDPETVRPVGGIFTIVNN